MVKPQPGNDNPASQPFPLRILWLALVAVVAFCTLSYRYVDKPLMLLTLRGGAPLHAAFAAFTDLGQSHIVLIPAALAYVWFRFVKRKTVHSRRALFVFCAVAGGGIVNAALKGLSGRCRPTVFLNDGLYGFRFFAVAHDFTSFPSGHANTVAALAVALGLLYPRSRAGLFVFALCIAASRVVIRAHYLGDVVAGVYVGAVSALLAWRWMRPQPIA